MMCHSPEPFLPISVTRILMRHGLMAQKLGIHDPTMTDTDGSVRFVLQGDGRCSAMSMPSLRVSHQSMGCDLGRYKQR
jgi:hypothetical protein